MVAGEEENGYSGGGKTANAPGKLALLGLGRLAGLIGITAEKNKVDLVFKSVVDKLIKDGKEIAEAGGQTGGGVGTPVGLNAKG